MMKRGQKSVCLAALLLGAALAVFPAVASSSPCTATYEKAADTYYRLKSTNAWSPSNLTGLMDSFQEVADNYPDCHKADDALYMVGVLGLKAYRDHGMEVGLDRALAAMTTLHRNYGASTLADDAIFHCGEIYEIKGEFEKAEEAYKKAIEARDGDMARQAGDRLAAIPDKIELARKKEKESAAEKPEVLSAPPAKEEKQIPPPGRDQPAKEDTPAKRNPPAAPGQVTGEEMALARLGISEEPIVEPGAATTNDTAPASVATPPVAQNRNSVPTNATAPATTQNPNSARLLGMRYWSNKDYTRVVVDLDRQVPYAPAHLLRPDPELKTPPRLYIDFQGAVIATELKDQVYMEAGCYTLPIGDGLLKKARAGQYQPDVARVVLDIERIDRYHAFALPGNPFRYVIDVYGSPAPVARTQEKPKPATAIKPEVSQQKPATPAPPRRKTIVVLDPGHGGKDPGAVGPSGVREKDVTLAIARRAERIIEARRPDVDVVLTRKDDRYLGLVDRTAMANTLNAELFVSIHCNASPSAQARGVETYYLDNTTDRAALKLAAKENFVTEQVLTESKDTTNLILADLITASKVEDSVPLARSIQSSLMTQLGRKWKDVSDKGVKKAPFWVLTGATMPCVLVEVSFISNKTDERRLRSSEYQQASAEAIASGVISYLDNYPQVSMAR